ncbi:MAG TPA: pseudouridine-5'-phosphate glycosidase [Gammaproteobacteria bacterium]|nr:pseudouridine-5'-phosphate glycosidase [Gammaproteobacteria bacterium]
MTQFFEYSHEVEQAVRQKKPVLALESTLITHGLPYPENIETAKALEALVREQGVTPATIAVLAGKIKIGLNEDELELLVNNDHIVKASKRDLSYVITEKLNAGTTVAATLFCAEAVGIRVFATGGIGGVHRGNEQDISADLIELSRTPMAVVCAGAKAILDLPRTLEFLETHSIPIVGYRTDSLPAFYSASSPYQLPTRIDDIQSLVKLLNTHWQLGLSSSVLIANPIPRHEEIDNNIIEPAIASALEEANEKQIKGKAITPFLLNEMATATQGKSLKANIALIKNNVVLAAQLAKALSM